MTGKMPGVTIIRSLLAIELLDLTLKGVAGGAEAAFNYEVPVILARLITFWVRTLKTALIQL
jgi:hypothetical protein